MTNDERLEVLTVNIESLHASCSELHASMAELRRTMEENDRRLSPRMAQLIDLNTRLSNNRRLGNLEG